MIRNAEAQDLEHILVIYNDAILNSTATYSYEVEDLEAREQWLKEKQQKKEPVIVYEEAGHVVAFATYGTFRNKPAYRYTVEHSIYVGESARCKGVATQLLEELIRIAGTEGYRVMVAGIDASNSGSVRLHEKFGFVHAGTLKNVGFKFDRWLDLSFYQLDLYEKEASHR
ncbi:GNAT family N-acetyltransferase [Salinicoccus sp. RF5]|uniref:GNAT family N-acetyltransferase n=1 Tax=Salinicoccus sp. RF5 TaxID=2748874 RepID=UPI001E6159FD|nr:GNAT family N-acetyltransferase [Salinicoccus sp. RF5]MCC4721841.1 N-acetyltransferase family protein [Salinicoccus sp. RF5]